jgi:hypothetical protein
LSLRLCEFIHPWIHVNNWTMHFQGDTSWN